MRKKNRKVWNRAIKAARRMAGKFAEREALLAEGGWTQPAESSLLAERTKHTQREDAFATLRNELFTLFKKRKKHMTK